jgi:5-methylcytosine-specific restriction endonuclease McrA
MGKEEYSREFTDLIASITNKRANVVINHILEHGFITTEDLENYGYKHAPRAARDVRESGVPLKTYRVKSSTGKSIAAYKFDELAQLQANRNAGRISFPKEFKGILYELCNGHCSICNIKYEERYLQVDHRVPYEVGGDLGTSRKIEDFMLVCGSCNRSKSWSCEHCENWITDQDPDVCLQCYWGNPNSYTHIALRAIRRIDLTWEEDEVKYYDAIKKLAEFNNTELPKFIKEIISKNR